MESKQEQPPGDDTPVEIAEDTAHAPDASQEAPAPEPTAAIPSEDSAATAAEPSVNPFADVEDATEIPDKYLTIFVDETEDSLDELAEILESGDSVDLANLLALGHRIKGSAASIGLNRAARMTHVMEDLIQDLRDQQQQPTAEMREVFQFVVDCLRDYLQALRERSSADRLAEAYLKLQAIDEAFRANTASSESAEDENVSTEATEEAQTGELTLDDVLNEFAERVRPLINGEHRTIFGVLRFMPQLPLVGIKARLIMDRLADVGQIFETDPAEDTLEDAPGLDHLCFALITNENENAIHSRLLADGVLEVRLLAAELNGATADQPTGQHDSTASPTPTGAANGASADSKPNAPNGETMEKPTAKPAEAKEKKDRPIETIRVDIDRLDHLMNQAGQLVINKARFARLGEQFKSIEAHKQSSHTLQNASTLLDKIAADVESAEPGKNFGLVPEFD